MTADNDVRGMDGAAVVALSRDVILAKALELADAEGIENLSVRKLASSLNRTAMALYRYFDSMGFGARVHRGGCFRRSR